MIENEKMKKHDHFKNYKISVLGLGYVGLELALSLSKAGFKTTGFDLDEGRINQLIKHQDLNFEQ